MPKHPRLNGSWPVQSGIRMFREALRKRSLWLICGSFSLDGDVLGGCLGGDGSVLRFAAGAGARRLGSASYAGRARMRWRRAMNRLASAQVTNSRCAFFSSPR